ncbi:hypothetical protein ACWEPC_20920 [Nonomuraea sp. NPDC004297]
MSHPSVRLSTDAITGLALTSQAADRAVLNRSSTPRPAPIEALPTDGLEADTTQPREAFDSRGSNSCRADSLPLDVAEHAFALLMRGPAPLSVDGALLGHGLPARPIPLNELPAMLLHPSCSRGTRDHVWRHLIGQARAHRGAWMVAAVALAIPMLRRLIMALADKIPAERIDREDLEADVLTAYMEALSGVNLTWSHPLLRLSRMTHIAVIRAHAADRPGPSADPDLSDRTDRGQQTLTYPAGHPDVLLAQAVAQGMITELEAELIATTRLDGVPLSSYCRRHSLLYCAMLKRRQRAETALRQALQRGDLSSRL